MNRLAAVSDPHPTSTDPLWQIADQIEDGPAGEWPIPGFIHPGLTVITGQPHAGKTTLALAMADAVLSGGSWLGAAVNTLGAKRVLFLCEDVSSRNRARAALADYGGRAIVEKATLWGERAPLRDVVVGRNIGVVFIDSLFAVAADENDQMIAGRVISALQGAGAPTVVIHHERKGGKSGQPTGSQRYAAAYRHTIRLLGSGESSDSGVLPLRLEISGNDVPGKRSLTMTASRDTLEVRLVGEGKKVKPKMRPRLSNEGKARVLGEIAKRLGIEQDLGPRDYAKRLVGPEGGEHADKQAEVRLRWDLPKAGVGFRTVAGLIEREREAFDDGFCR